MASDEQGGASAGWVGPRGWLCLYRARQKRGLLREAAPVRPGGADRGSNPARLQGTVLSIHRWAGNKRGSGGAQWRTETARRPAAAGSPAARPSAGPGVAPVGAPSRARSASFSEIICPECGQRACGIHQGRRRRRSQAAGEEESAASLSPERRSGWERRGDRERRGD